MKLSKRHVPTGCLKQQETRRSERGKKKVFQPYSLTITSQRRGKQTSQHR